MATLLLCLFNVVVAVYLSYVVLLPLAFRLSDSFGPRRKVPPATGVTPERVRNVRSSVYVARPTPS